MVAGLDGFANVGSNPSRIIETFGQQFRRVLVNAPKREVHMALIVLDVPNDRVI